MVMTIEGCACLGSFGHGQEALLAALEGASLSPFTERTDTSGLADFFAARALRQCDHFSRLALLAAARAAQNAGTNFAGREDCAIILASGYGPARPTFDFLDSILDHGETMASPLAFSLSVHNIPAAIIAKTMGVIGPCATVCQYESAVASGLLLAQSWLDEGRAETVLFGAVDEMTAILKNISARLINEREDRSAPAVRRALPLGEAAVFFVLSKDEGREWPGIGKIETITVEHLHGDEESTVPVPVDSSEVRLMSGAFPEKSRAACKALYGGAAYGNLPVAQALDCALALSLLQRDGKKTALCLNQGSGARSAVTITGSTI